MEHVREAVGQRLGRPVGIQVTVVISLYAAARWDIILAGGHLELSAKGHVTYALHKALAVGALTDEHSTVEILHASCQYLGTRGRPSIYHQHEWHQCIYWFQSRAIVVVGAGHFALGTHQMLSAGEKQAGDVDTLIHRTASVAAQVYDEPACSLFTQTGQRIPHLAEGSLAEGVQIDVANTVGQHAAVAHTGCLDGLACQAEGLLLVTSAHFHLE